MTKKNRDLNNTLDLSEEKVKLSKSEKEKLLKEHFELQLSSDALDALNNKDYIKSAMLSWSYIEEYFLPTTINLLSKFHKLPIKKSAIEKTNVSTLIYYYYFLSHDQILFNELEKTRKARNELVHNLYGASSVARLDELAKKSAEINLNTVMEYIWYREEGKTPYPSTMIAINARNNLRKEQRKRLEKLIWYKTIPDMP